MKIQTLDEMELENPDVFKNPPETPQEIAMREKRMTQIKETETAPIIEYECSECGCVISESDLQDFEECPDCEGSIINYVKIY